jgi:hypothetical protein
VEGRAKLQLRLRIAATVTSHDRRGRGARRTRRTQRVTLRHLRTRSGGSE